jgi:hypothetical protein
MSSISTTTTGKCKVQLIATKSQPAYAILGGYYTTCIMNFISWNKAYCIFPRATLLFHETVPLWFTHSCYSELHQKYSRRGWRMRTEPVAFFRNPQEPDFFLPPPMQNKRRTLQQGRAYPLGYNVTEDRRIGAADTWTVTLSTAGVMRPPQPDSVLDYSSFQIVGHGSQVNALGMHFRTTPFSS